MPSILGANTLSSGYDVANSLRFDGSNDYLNITSGSSPTSTKKFTASFWLKRSELGREQHIFGGVSAAQCYFISDDRLRFADTTSGTNYYTTQKFRDVSAWYHIVIAVDTTLGTAGDRARIYVNGSEITAFDTETNATQNNNTAYNIGSTTYVIGRYNPSQSQNYYYSGYMAEYVFIDGQQLDPTSFGEFDEDSSIWKPIDVSGLTFGNNGFYLDFEDSSSLGNDAAGSNNFSVNNLTAIDQTTDTCTNNFATLNPLDGSYYAGGTFAQGNTYYTSVSSKHDFAVSNFGITSGKWYAEFKVHQDTDYNAIGISDHSYQGSNQELSEDNYSYAYINYDSSNSIVRGNGSNILTSMPLFGNGDIIGVALDLENHKLYFSKNGTFINSGDPTSGSTGTGAVSIQDLSSVTSTYGQGVYFFAVGLWNTSASGNYDANFGNPAFAISSGNTDANGYGNMEFAVPSGYFVLNSKNLAEYG